MHFNAYPELLKHARSVLLYLLQSGYGTGTPLTDVVADCMYVNCRIVRLCAAGTCSPAQVKRANFA